MRNLNGTDNYEIDRSHLIGADIFQPSQVLDNEVVRKELDFSQPIALYHCGTLHHYSGERSPADIMREYIDALPSGSYVALSHFFDPETTDDSALARKMEGIFLHSPMGSGMFRTRAEIESMFDGLELVDPGLTSVVGFAGDAVREHLRRPGVGRGRPTPRSPCSATATRPTRSSGSTAARTPTEELPFAQDTVIRSVAGAATGPTSVR